MKFTSSELRTIFNLIKIGLSENHKMSKEEYDLLLRIRWNMERSKFDNDFEMESLIILKKYVQYNNKVRKKGI